MNPATPPAQFTKATTNATGYVRTPLPDLRDPQAAFFQDSSLTIATGFYHVGA